MAGGDEDGDPIEKTAGSNWTDPTYDANGNRASDSRDGKVLRMSGRK